MKASEKDNQDSVRWLAVVARASSVAFLLLSFGMAGCVGDEEIRYPANGRALREQFLEHGYFDVRVPGDSIRIEGTLESMSCVNGTNLQGEDCRTIEVHEDGTETYHPWNFLSIVGKMQEHEDSYVEVVLGDHALYGIAKWGFVGDTTHAYRFDTEGGEYGNTLHQVVKKGYASREPYERWPE